VAYTQATANTGGLAFDASGNLGFALFGNDCGAGSCTEVSGTNGFYMDVLLLPGLVGNFIYTVPNVTTESFRGTTTAALAVPEPGTLALLAVGLAGLGMVLRTQASAGWRNGRLVE
jgi:hypothetical protein